MPKNNQGESLDQQLLPEQSLNSPPPAKPELDDKAKKLMIAFLAMYVAASGWPRLCVPPCVRRQVGLLPALARCPSA